MAGVVLVRADDLLVLGVSWAGLSLAGGSSGPAHLIAGTGARLVLVLPPQHIAEETSPRNTAAPLNPVTDAGFTVPVWRGVLAGATRLAFAVAAGTEITLTCEGVLAAVANNPLIIPAGVPGRDETAIELPWRLVIAPRARAAAGRVVCRHPVRPTTGTSALWRTRLVDSGEATLDDAGLTFTVSEPALAAADDPPFSANNTIPLHKASRVKLASQTAEQRARLTRLELSALGGTFDGTARFPNFEWDQRAVLGRDMHVRTLVKGVMYPLGHPAQFLEIVERVFDPSAGGAAVLRRLSVLTIVDPVRDAPADGPIRRAFPFGAVEILRTVFTDVVPAWIFTTLPGAGEQATHFRPRNLAGDDVLFPIACTTSTGAFKLELPLLFVADLLPIVDSLASPVLAQRLADDYGAKQIPLTPTHLDLVGSRTDERKLGDVHEVHSLTVGGVAQGLNLAQGYRARLTELEVGLPALRMLRGGDPRAKVELAPKYIQNGPAEDVLLEMLPNNVVPVDFSKAADRTGGLLAPRYETNALSRTLGPIDRLALPDPATGFIDPGKLFRTDDASLLGFPLRTLLSQLEKPPQLTSVPLPGAGMAPEVHMLWEDVKLKSVGPFRAGQATRLALDVTTAPNRSTIKCTVRDFALELPPGAKRVLRLSFAEMTFVQEDGKSPQLRVAGVQAEFLGDLTLLEELAKKVDLGAAGKLIDVRPTGLTVQYTLAIPSVTSGVFVARNMVLAARIEIPFDGRPMSVALSFATRANPFQLGVLMFGGGGYIELTLDRDGLKRFEASLEFGAFVALDFVIASGEVHALGGVHFVLDRGVVTITGYVRIGGSVEVLGLVSVSIELYVSLSYNSERNALVGRATLVIEIDLTLWSERVEIDSGEWVLAGNDQRQALDDARWADDALERWRRYRASFAELGQQARDDAGVAP